MNYLHKTIETKEEAMILLEKLNSEDKKLMLLSEEGMPYVISKVVLKKKETVKSRDFFGRPTSAVVPEHVSEVRFKTSDLVDTEFQKFHKFTCEQNGGKLIAVANSIRKDRIRMVSVNEGVEKFGFEIKKKVEEQ